MIKSVGMVDFKGESETFRLSGCDLFTGPNGAGKTRRIQAIEFCIRGAVGDIKNNEELFTKFSTGKSMTVMVDIGNDTLTRQIVEETRMVDGKREYKYTGVLKVTLDSSEEITGIKRCDEWIKENINIPSVVFNFHEFEKMTTTQRRDFIKAIVTMGDMSKDELISLVEARTNCPDMDTDYEAALDEAIAELRASLPNKLGEELITAAVKFSGDKFTALNKQKKSDAGGASKLTQLKNEKEGNIRLVSKLEESIKTAQADLTDQNVKLSQANQILKQKTTDMASVTALNARKEELNTTDYDLIIEAHRATKGETEAQIQEELLVLDHGPSIKEREERIRMHENCIVNQYANIAAETESVNILKSKLKESKEMLLNLQGEFKCPLTKMICNADMGGITQRINESVENDNMVLASTESFIDDLKGAVQEHKEIIARAKAEIDAIRESTRLDQEKNNQIAAANRAIVEKVHAIDQQIAIASAAKSGVDSKLYEIDSQVSALMCKSYGEFEDPNETQAIIESLTEQIAKEKAELDTLKEKQNLLQSQMRAVQDAQESELKFKVWSDIRAAIGLKGIQGNMIKQNLGPVVDEMSTILKELGRTESFFFSFETKKGNEDFNFGWVRNGEEIIFESLSKGEQLTTAAGLLVIFLERMGAKLKLVMIDEINQLYGVRRGDFFKGFSALSDRLDNIIVCGAIGTNGNGLYRFELTEL